MLGSVGVNNNGNLYISHNFNLGSDTLLVTPYQYNDNQWHHFALVKLKGKYNYVY